MTTYSSKNILQNAFSGFGDGIRNASPLHGFCLVCKKSKNLSSLREIEGSKFYAFADDPILLFQAERSEEDIKNIGP